MSDNAGKKVGLAALAAALAVGVAYVLWPQNPLPKENDSIDNTAPVDLNTSLALSAKRIGPPPPPPPPSGGPQSPPRPSALVSPTTVFEAAWGSKPGQMGMTPGNESSPEMPMAFVVDPQGNMHILDQMNGRIQSFGPRGTLLRTTQLPSPRYQDVVAKEDGLVALQRFPELELFEVGTGKKTTLDPKKLPKPLAQNGAITALTFVQGQPYLERDHGAIYPVEEGAQGPLPGRPLGDGLFIVARVQNKLKGTFYVSALDQNSAVVWQVPLKTALVMEDIRALEIQEKQKIVLVTSSYLENPKTFAIEKTALEAFVVSAQGQLIKSLTLQKHTEEMPEYDNFKPFGLSPQGNLLQMVATPKGLKVMEYPL